MQKSAPTATIHDEVTATLKRLQAKNPGLKRQLKSAHGYAVFPSVGKASVVVGGAYGRGEVYEKGEVIGHATLSQLTLGVQVGGDTFSQILIFQDKSSLDQFKRGKTSFAANASAVLVKAGAQGTKNPAKGVTALAFSRGGMLLELAIGGQKFSFKPMDDEGEGDEGEEQGGEGQEQESGAGASGLAGRTMSMVREHPVAATVIGLGVAAGVGLLVARKLRGGAASDEQDEQEDAQGDEENRPEEEMSGDEGEEDEERDEDEEGEEEGDEDAGDAEGSAGEEDEGDEGGEDESENEDRQAGRRQRGRSGGVLSRILGAGRGAAGGRR
jgi:hypothetical protein